jgi:hypothetical protein
MSGHVRVEPGQLLAVAETLHHQTWPATDAQLKPADALPLASDAVANLKQNADTLQGFQAVAEAQNQHLHGAFTSAANAYTAVDENESTRFGEPGRQAAVDAIPIPPSTTQLPAIPDGPALTPVTASEYSSVLDTQSALKDGDAGQSLRQAASAYGERGRAMGANAQGDFPTTTWEGDAADAAYTRLNEYSHWLRELQSAWEKLADAGNKLASAHEFISQAHDPVAAAYVNAMDEARHLRAQSPPDNAAINKQLELVAQLHKVSDGLREEYAQLATFDAVKPVDPPFGSRKGGGSTGGGGNGSGGGGGGGTGSGGGGATGETGSAMPGAGGMNDAAQAAGSTGAGSTGSGGGSTGGGGSQSGGGSPSGGGGGATGGLPGGLPDGATGMPTLPDDPSLHPAAADGSGGGGSGGGGGGGLGKTPLQPNLGGSSVGPGPAGGAVSGGAGPGAASATGGMGMGGGAPMHGGGHGQGGGKEKKRNPALAPDENIYAEERPWTEPVIGNRRRKEVADTSKDSK